MNLGPWDFYFLILLRYSSFLFTGYWSSLYFVAAEGVSFAGLTPWVLGFGPSLKLSRSAGDFPCRVGSPIGPPGEDRGVELFRDMRPLRLR